jgi:hypothetical protein
MGQEERLLSGLVEMRYTELNEAYVNTTHARDVWSVLDRRVIQQVFVFSRLLAVSDLVTRLEYSQIGLRSFRISGIIPNTSVRYLRWKITHMDILRCLVNSEYSTPLRISRSNIEIPKLNGANSSC